MPGAPLSLPEREEIAVVLVEDPAVPWAEIARRVGRHPTTIAREVSGHGGRDAYRPAVAQRCRRSRKMLRVDHRDCRWVSRPGWAGWDGSQSAMGTLRVGLWWAASRCADGPHRPGQPS